MASFNKDFVEHVHIVAAFAPVDLQSSANTGDWVSLKGYSGCAVLIHSAIGTDNDDLVATLNQATAVAGTATKTLNISRYWEKIGSTALTAVGTWTAQTQAAGDGVDHLTTAENHAMLLLDVKADDLDVAGGFDCLQLIVADTGSNAQLGSAIYLLYGPKVGQAVLESAIVD